MQNEANKSTADAGDYYLFGSVLVGVVTFIGIWLYAISQWGLLIGLIFGWIPAVIGALICGLLWPLLLGLVLLVIGYILLNQ